MIKKNKDLLFGSLPHPLTNEERHNAWKGISDKGISLGIIKSTKDWEYMRDVTWANRKRRTLVGETRQQTKNRNRKRIGPLYNELDNLVLDIIGRESPLIRGLNVPESMQDPSMASDNDELPSLTPSPVKNHLETPSTTRCRGTERKRTSTTSSKPKVLFPLSVNSETNGTVQPPTLEAATPQTSSKHNTKDLYASKKAVKQHNCTKIDLDYSAKFHKIQLQLDLMEIDKRYKAILLYKLEKENGLSPSELTREFHDVGASFGIEEDFNS